MRIATTTILIALMLAGSTARAQQDFSLTALDGKSVALSGMRGRVVVLLFTGIQDPQCRDEFKALDALTQRFRDKDVNIYWVSINPVSAASDDRLRSQCGAGTSVAILRDSSQAAFKRFGCSQLPTAIILDRKGQVQGKPRGGFNPNADFVNDLSSVIDSLLTGK